MKLDPGNARPKAMRNITAADIEGEVVAYSPRLGKGYHLNDTAAWLWKHCDGKLCVEELIVKLRQEFDCGQADVRSDVDKIFTELLDLGLIEFEET
jgi:hypothetical protein